MIALACVVLAVVVAFFDWRTGRIPNWLTMPVIVAAPVVWWVAAGPWHAALSLLGLTACAIVPVGAFGERRMGGGDVKALIAVGAVVGIVPGLVMQALALGLLTLYPYRRIRTPMGPFLLVASVLVGGASVVRDYVLR
jgi:prepilin peptidase CpaA